MKCTTKILIGIILSGMVVVVVGSIMLFSIGHSKSNLRLDDRLIQVNVAPFRVVNVLVYTGKGLEDKYIAVVGDLSVLPTVDGQHTFSYQAEMKRYLSVVSKGDTLSLIFNILTSNLPEELAKSNRIDLFAFKMKLTADSSLVSLYSQTRQSVKLNHLKADSVALSGEFLEVDSCDFRTFSVNRAWRANVNSSRIHNLYLDLDGVRNWGVANCQLENEYLTGSGTHYNDLQKGECRFMYWKPKSEDAQINVTLKEESRVSLMN